jgi:type I restriction modification DNA specificity domain protein
MKNVNQYVMKDSGVQWIGQVPEHWIGYRMQYITRLEKGKMPQELTSTGGDAPYLTMDLLRNRETIVTYPVNTKGLVCVEDNDLLLLWDGANAGEILQAKRGYLGSTMAIIHYSKEIIESKFAFYFFKALERRFKEDANGTTIPHFNRASLNSCKYFLPPTLSEQRAISDWLDAKCADIDAAIELQQRMIDKLKAYKTAVIHQAVTKGLDKNANLKDSGVQWIGEVPEHWEVCKIKNICTYVNRGCAPNYVENGTYYAMNQATFSKGFLDYSSLKFTTENRKSAQVLKQDILLASTGGGILGKVFYYNEESDLFYADSHVTILRVNKRTNDSRYLFYNLAIKYDLINALLAKGSTNQTELQRDLLKNHYIQCPPLTEQRAIADWLDAKCADIDAIIALKEQKQEKLKAYKKTIIFEYVTGKKQVANINK